MHLLRCHHNDSGISQVLTVCQALEAMLNRHHLGSSSASRAGTIHFTNKETKAQSWNNLLDVRSRGLSESGFYPKTL